jgi:hypothetical protein
LDKFLYPYIVNLYTVVYPYRAKAAIVNSGLFLDLKNDSYLWTLYGLRILARLLACIAPYSSISLEKKNPAVKQGSLP